MNLKFQKIFITVNPAITRKKALLFIEEKLFEAWDLQYGEPLTLMAGCRSVPVLVQPFPSSQPTIKLSFDTNQILSLPAFSDPISVTFHAEDRSINIGPFFAALINQLPLKDGTFGEMEKFYQEMKSYCHQQGFSFFLVGIQSLKEGVVEGYWPGQNGWQTLTLPIPNVFYNRIHSRRMEESPTFDLFTNELKSYSIPMFNGRFLSKFDVHELLLLENELLSNLPDTILFNEKEAFFTFLENHSVIYLKPSSGSQGRNICRLTQVDGKWKIEQTGHIQNVHIADTNEKLYNALKKFCRKQAYILQKGISLFEIDQRKVDFRILLHQNEQFQWKVTSMVARIGDPGNIVSNLAQGGMMKNGSDFLKEVFDPQEAGRLHQRLIRLAKKTAHTLAENHDDLFGELGIDLALDVDTHPWIIEVNSKPSKKFQGNYETFRPSVKSIVEFMLTLDRENHP
ncbi:YheC/YheD family endospore coat-associated protein [Peribacillus butanolivorans]|uniref:YheC/YheD family endospore coat-associated protein n=1 Tax=Peribacillus butanolivorans TaxID=421767 RepID=UPI0006A72B09|nr:YheC/YheD family protein [Peribacillus butanolivorans]